MEKIINRSTDFAKSIRAYAFAKWEMISFRIAVDISSFVADILGLLMVCLFVFAFSLFAGIALAMLIGDWLNNVWIGYAVVSCLFLVKGIVLWKIRARLFQYPLLNKLLRKLNPSYDKDQE